MKVFQVNATANVGSTGKICISIMDACEANDIDCYLLCAQSKSSKHNVHTFGSFFYYKWQALKSRVLGNYGLNSKKVTKRIIQKIEEISPDIIHLHNLHSHNCNIKLLFDYLKHKNVKVYWTFHDCWAVTAYCPNFDMIGCDKWKTSCRACVQKEGTTWLFDKSKQLYRIKKECFTGMQDLTIITPSHWLADIVKQSFMQDYPVKVIHNGIDLSVFKPTESDFRERYGIAKDKYLLLGVAFGWGKRKGLDVFVELAKRLPEKSQIVLVGTDKKVDKQLPKNIISIHRTQNQTELAEIYTAADLFVNPTREDNFPTVNMESLACGTPVVTFRTGGSPECIDDTCGAVVEKDDIDSLEREIVRIVEERPYSAEACLLRAAQFDQKDKFAEYVKLYREKV